MFLEIGMSIMPLEFIPYAYFIIF